MAAGGDTEAVFCYLQQVLACHESGHVDFSSGIESGHVDLSCEMGATFHARGTDRD